MRSVYMLMHQRKPNTEALAKKVADAFAKHGLCVSAEEWLFDRMGEESPTLFQQRAVEQCDAIIAVGGDGTLLRANALALQHHLPVLGINGGRLGFLTEVELEQLNSACERLASDDYIIEERMMLEVRLEGRTYLALNDVVVSRGGYSRLIGMDAFVNDEQVGHFVADGLIVSTPTGSTGYSLSAGGPLVCPEVECMILTPICAHSLQHRPVVTNAAHPITIRLTEERSAMVAIDGREPLELPGGHLLRIVRSAHPTRLIRLEPGRFFSKVRIKLSEWSC